MSLEPVAEGVYIQRHPLRMMGCHLGRVVTVIRLGSGKLLIHSTAPFSNEDRSDILSVGEPAYLMEASNFHDTATDEGRRAFGEVPYFVPSGFKKMSDPGTADIDELPDDGEVVIVKIGGVPKLNEYAVFHTPTKTLIVADLFFNLPDSVGTWTKWFLKTTVGLDTYPGQSRLLSHYIKDRSAYIDSVNQIAELDFDRIIVGHGDPVTHDAKAVFREILLTS